MMNRSSVLRLFLFVFGLHLLVMPSMAEEPLTKSVTGRTNIIYINVDDLGWADLSCQGSKYYETPNIDKLATQGMRFTNAYAPASNCAPSRACCLTGQYTPRHGVYTVGNSARGSAKNRRLIPVTNTPFIKSSHRTIAHALTAAGYKTATIGKWHISKDPLQNGFQTNIAGSSAGAPVAKPGGYHSPYRYKNCVAKQKGEYLTDRLTNEAITFITKNKTEPFFLYLPFYSVHTPLQAKPKKKAAYAKKKGTKAHNNPTYAAMISSVDENIGRLMATVKKLGLEENTLVLFTSDNGGMWKYSKQWPLRAGKGSYYEGGIREPLIVRWPAKIKPGTTCDVPVIGIDFFPTFLAATNVKKPKGKEFDGVNILPLLTQTGTIKKRPLFWHFPIYLQASAGPKDGIPETIFPKWRTVPGSVIRYGDWKLHEYFHEKVELYNLKNDIGEKNDLSKKEPAKVKELLGMLNKWRKRVKAPLPEKKSPEPTIKGSTE